MFTGIVQATCDVVTIEKNPGFHTLEVSMTSELTKGLQTGASVANNGVCLTVTRIEDHRVFYDVMEETLCVTNLALLQAGDPVNVERSLCFGSEIGGHILSGHIHTRATVRKLMHTSEHYDLELQLDEQWLKYIFYKGFVGVNGCSLTVGKVSTDSFMLHLIPETLALTNLSQLSEGDEVNIEIDTQTQVIVDTVERYLSERSLG
ncbi:riboflavin synthase subunit alpha [Shewanella sp. NIFS-20-20]|uniref:riboflavin synthase subunit alpha n=1 Tax=Shewanella sp. NIFS-20-20 TaxID=2853806 RepID=UPI001C4726A9|nr:riboflavin synthase subunit alpha [Shewanella sp. NIFS-20-20]MBV7316873.1 riboflavin synthase subunit alpha [Shewanella sp. NIFS-20-20]